MGSPEDQAGQFVEVIGSNINDVWKTKLRGYTPPTTVLYEQGTQTGCGFGQSAMGPFYCPTDQKVYLDLGFWREMETKLGASGADFAKAYVIAHEFGHHVQHLTGATDQVQRAQQSARSQAEGNKYSVALELQADCYAGVWARNAAAVSGRSGGAGAGRSGRGHEDRPGHRRRHAANAAAAAASRPKASPTARRRNGSNGCNAAIRPAIRRRATPFKGL